MRHLSFLVLKGQAFISIFFLKKKSRPSFNVDVRQHVSAAALFGKPKLVQRFALDALFRAFGVVGCFALTLFCLDDGEKVAVLVRKYHAARETFDWNNHGVEY
jgi:hypothetical protein